VGIAPMNYPLDPPWNPEQKQVIYESIIARLAKFIAIITRRHFSVAVFGTDIGCDPAAIEDLRSRLQKCHKIITAPYEPVGSVDEVLRRMDEFDYVVTCRFHAVVFAHLLNKPILAVSLHPKVTSLMTGLGLSAYCADIRTFEPARPAESFETLVKNQEDVKSRLTDAVVKYRMRLAAQFDELWAIKHNIDHAYGGT
jgi:polysaccharide pyruvyl transferase WcaK-like protein